MKQETIEYVAKLEAEMMDLPERDSLKWLLLELVKQTARIADTLEDIRHEGLITSHVE